MDLLCAIRELRAIGKEISESYEARVKLSIEHRIKKRLERKEAEELKEAENIYEPYLLLDYENDLPMYQSACDDTFYSDDELPF